MQLPFCLSYIQFKALNDGNYKGDSYTLQCQCCSQLFPERIHYMPLSFSHVYDLPLTLSHSIINLQLLLNFYNYHHHLVSLLQYCIFFCPNNQNTMCCHHLACLRQCVSGGACAPPPAPMRSSTACSRALPPPAPMGQRRQQPPRRQPPSPSVHRIASRTIGLGICVARVSEYIY